LDFEASTFSGEETAAKAGTINRARVKRMGFMKNYFGA
jgi:hypothetical protein